MRCADATMMVTVPLYARVMGDSWSQIAESVRDIHATHSITRAHGYVRIEHGRHHLARVLARVLRWPRPSAAAETELIVTARDRGEEWQRTFNGRRLETRQYKWIESELAERYGMLEFRFRLDASGGSLLYVQREASLLFGVVGLRIPRQWAPQVHAREDSAGPKRVKIEVNVVFPGIGLLIAYDGIIEVEEAHA